MSASDIAGGLVATGLVLAFFTLVVSLYASDLHWSRGDRVRMLAWTTGVLAAALLIAAAWFAAAGGW